MHKYLKRNCVTTSLSPERSRDQNQQKNGGTVGNGCSIFYGGE